jgi:hypothetical protein
MPAIPAEAENGPKQGKNGRAFRKAGIEQKSWLFN